MYSFKQAIYILAFSSVTLCSCQKDDDGTPSSTNTNVTQGKWKVTLYNDSGTDETFHFSGYEFSFSSSGSVSAVKSSSTISGTWRTGTDDSQNKLILDFGSTVPFEEINDDWHILEQTSSKIRLEDVSGGNGETDLLTFEKI